MRTAKLRISRPPQAESWIDGRSLARSTSSPPEGRQGAHRYKEGLEDGFSIQDALDLDPAFITVSDPVRLSRG